MKKLFSLSIVLLLILIVVLQTGCFKDENTAYADVTASADTIVGLLKYKQVVDNVTTVVAWPYGNATIKAVDPGNNVMASASVNTDGTFRLILPATLKGNYFISLAYVINEQGGTLKATPEDIKMLGTTQYKVEYSDNGVAKSFMVNLYKLNLNNTIYRSYYYNFYDQNGTFTGKGTAGNVFNWSFVKGWGIVESYVTNSSTGAFNSKSVANVPSGAIWVNGF